jgi:hypothetical protein
MHDPVGTPLQAHEGAFRDDGDSVGATPDPIPFVVHCPDGWTVEAGIGARPDARDVNWGWRRDDDDERERPPVNETLLRWSGRTPEEFDQHFGRGTR